jgi:predicted ATPase
MLIESIQFKDHPVFGDLKLDFTNNGGEAHSLVILAGENGTGKTSILDAIAGLFSSHHQPMAYSVLLSLSDVEATAAARAMARDQFKPGDRLWLNKLEDTGQTDVYVVPYDGSPRVLIFSMGRGGTLAGNAGFEHWLAFYDPAQILQQVGTVQATGSSTLDQRMQHQPLRVPDYGNRSVQQVLVDITAADAEDIAQWLDNHPGEAPPKEIMSNRAARFKTAFSYMFDTMRFVGNERSSGAIKAIFEDGGKRRTLNELSSGEKQVVIRGGFLLRDVGLAPGAIVLIDEPEIGLHPDWQSRVLGYYRKILSDDRGQHPQMFVATHSPFVVHNAENAKIVVLEKDKATGLVVPMPQPTYPTVGAKEAVKAFKLDAFVSAIGSPSLLVLVEGETDGPILKAAWEKLYPAEVCPFSWRPTFGARKLSAWLNESRNLDEPGHAPVVGLFDFDHEGFCQWNGVWKDRPFLGDDDQGIIKRHSSKDAWAMLLPVPAFRRLLASINLRQESRVAIELLFRDEDIPADMRQTQRLAGGIEIFCVPGASKKAFAAHVQSLDASKFNEFRSLFSRLRQVLAHSI